MKAVILAGGEGVRLRPLTCERPKPMVPVADRPVLEHIVRLLVQHGIREIGVTLQYLPGEIQQFLGDGSAFGARISYFYEEVPLGTAGGVRQCGSFLDEPFVVMSGDALTDVNLTEILRVHEERGAEASIVLARVSQPVEYGVVLLSPDGRISGFREKPSWGEVTNNLVNTGIYVLSPSVMELCPLGQKMDFAKDLFPRLLEEGRAFYGMETLAYWCDIGDPRAYLRANRDSLSGKVCVGISGYSPKPGIWMGENALLSENVTLTPPVYIGSNCTIGEGAILGPACVIGEGSFVDRGARVEESVLWNHVHLGAATTITRSILCNKVRVAAGARVQDGMVGSNAQVGRFATIREGAAVWPGRQVEDTEALTHSLRAEDSSESERWETRISFRESGVSGCASPEYLTRLGCAFGSLLGNSSSVAVSCDGSGAAQMMLSAVESGLAATGVQVKRGGDIVLPVLRWTCRQGLCDGGVYLSCQIRDTEDTVTIHLLNGHGNDLGKQERRRLQSLFRRDEYVTMRASHILPPQDLSDPEDFYLADLNRHFPEAYRTLKLPPASYYSRQEREAVVSYLTAKLYPESPIFLSVSSTLSVERVARQFDRPVVRCGRLLGDVMEAMEAKMDVPGVYEQYLMLVDDLALDLALAQYYSVAEDPQEFHRFLHSRPLVYYKRREFVCSNDRKADVIRHFTQDEPFRERFQVLDGLLCEEGESVVRLYPEEDRPVFLLDVESLREEYGADLMEQFGKLLEEYLQGSRPD